MAVFRVGVLNPDGALQTLTVEGSDIWARHTYIGVRGPGPKPKIVFAGRASNVLYIVNIGHLNREGET